jgi:hypothetical protein
VVGYLYALLNEPDNDFHLILGTKTCKKPDCFMTAEVSGIPRIPANRRELADVRKQFQTQIQPYIDDGSAGGGGKYFVFDPPIPVRVVGPLFYDSKHKIDRKTREGAVGPEFARPSTSWEIHPVTQIDVNPDADERPNATLPILMLRDSQATLAPWE